MAFLNIPPKDNSTPLTAVEFNYLVDKLNARQLNNLIDVQSDDAVDKNIIQHNGSGWVFAKITDNHFTKTEIIALINGVDVSIPVDTYIERFFITDGTTINTINNADTITFNSSQFTINPTTGEIELDAVGNASDWDTAYDKNILSIAVTGTTTKTITLTQRDGSTLTGTFQDLSGAGGDGNDFLTSGSFDDTDGVITLNVANQSPVTVDIDGRFSLIGHDHVISDITGLQSALDGKVDDAQVLTDVPANALFTDTIYDDTAIQAEVDLNTVKVGVTAQMVSDIDTNTLKVGITPAQAQDIVDNNSKVSNVDHPLVETAVPVGAVFTDTIYNDAALQAAVALNTLKETNIAHPLVEKAVPSNALFTDTQLTQAEVGAFATAEGFIKSYVNTQRTDEEIRDVSNAQWTNGTNTTVVIDDTGNTIKINAVDTNTQLSQAQVGAYATAEGFIKSFTDTQRTDEEIRDVASAQWINGTNTTVVKDDAGNTLKINSTDTNTQLSQAQVGTFATAEGFIKIGSVNNSIANLLTLDNTWTGENLFNEDTRFLNEIFVTGDVTTDNAHVGDSVQFTLGAGSINLSRTVTTDVNNYFLKLPRANGQLAVSVQGNTADANGNIVVPNMVLKDSFNAFTNGNRFQDETVFSGDVLVEGINGISLEGSGKITDMVAGTNAGDAVNKGQMDSAIAVINNNYIRSNANDDFTGFIYATAQGSSGLRLNYISNALTPITATSGSYITGGADFAGLGKINNVAVQTWYGFSVSPTIGGYTVAQGTPAFSVDARNGNAYVHQEYYANGNKVLHAGNHTDYTDGKYLRSDVATTKTAGNLRMATGVPLYFGTTIQGLLQTNGVSEIMMNLLNSNFVIRDNSATRITFDRSSGNINTVGAFIGTGTGDSRVAGGFAVGDYSYQPQAKLTVTDYTLGTNNVAFFKGHGINEGEATTISINNGYSSEYRKEVKIGAVSEGSSSNLTGMALYTSPNSAGSLERVRIDSAGNVGIGTTNPESRLHIYELGADSPTTLILENGDVGINNTDDVHKIEFKSNDASTDGVGVAASIRVNAENAGNIYALAFNTQNIGDRGERMRIDGAGNVGIGQTNPTYKLDVSGTGRFTSTVTATNFVLSSDERLKENIQDFDYEQYIKMNVKTYELKSEKGIKRTGVIAQELEVDHPEFVRTDEEGMKSVAYTDLLMAKVAELEARLAKAGI